MIRKKRVVCAMSGGLDSSVAAALLKRAGPAPEQARYGVNFDVIGVFMRLYDLPNFKEGEKKARKVASVLKIPFLSFDLREEFKKKIIDYFLKEYKKGLTPNPCVVCNKEIKFGLLLEKAKNLGADFLATGHYARKQPTTYNLQPTTYKLLSAKDKEKDQSYFLWQLNQKQLKHILFPVGNYTKKQVRELAKKFKLPVSNIKESQEICFIKNTNINEFLKSRIKTNKGKIITTKGKVIGEHQGLYFYTIGQRKGIKLPGGPFYVLDKDLKKNLLIVTKNEKDLYKKELICQNINWLSGKEPKLPLKVKAKIRYRHQPATATISRLKHKVYSLRFARSQRAITPGQSVVFYKNNEVLGGGIIEKITKKCNIKD